MFNWRQKKKTRNTEAGRNHTAIYYNGKTESGPLSSCVPFAHTDNMNLAVPLKQHKAASFNILVALSSREFSQLLHINKNSTNEQKNQDPNGENDEGSPVL